MACTTANGNKSPKTLDEWKKAFTEDAHDDYINNRNMKPKAAPTGSESSNDKGTDSNGNGEKQIKVSLSDFPEFTGRQKDWNTFEREVVSTVGHHKGRSH